jgi:hypothetical protein
MISASNRSSIRDIIVGQQFVVAKFNEGVLLGPLHQDLALSFIRLIAF